MQIDIPWDRIAANIGRLILEASDNRGDELSSSRGGDGSGLDLEDSPGPDVRALLEGEALRRGLGCTGKGARGPTRV